MGLFKKLKKLSFKKIVKTVAPIAKLVASVVPGGALVAGAISIAQKVAAKAKGISDIAGRIAQGATGFAEGAAQPTGPPKGQFNMGLVAVAILGAWLLFSPNPGIIYSLFGAGTVTARVGRRRKNPVTKRRSAVTDVQIKVPASRKKRTATPRRKKRRTTRKRRR